VTWQLEELDRATAMAAQDFMRFKVQGSGLYTHVYSIPYTLYPIPYTLYHIPYTLYPPSRALYPKTMSEIFEA